MMISLSSPWSESRDFNPWAVRKARWSSSSTTHQHRRLGVEGLSNETGASSTTGRDRYDRPGAWQLGILFWRATSLMKLVIGMLSIVDSPNSVTVAARNPIAYSIRSLR
jgi:hypothetical protein